ncbi:hypothetical protein KHA80_05415 [Anaerobacillus sp. HL2]|nr:hypothetical protein KHA80_05415 [Anaerobacillus sp. HL2]
MKFTGQLLTTSVIITYRGKSLKVDDIIVDSPFGCFTAPAYSKPIFCGLYNEVPVFWVFMCKNKT